MDKTRHLSPETMEKLLESALSPEATATLQAHIADCGRCRRLLGDLTEFNDLWSAWTAEAHGRTFAEYPQEKQRRLCKVTAEGLKELFPEKLTPLQRKRVEGWHREALAPGGQAPAVGTGEAELTLLAAAPAFVGAVKGEVGTAFGVGVDEETGRGALIKVTAHVGDEILDTGKVTLVGAQVERQVHKGVEYQLTTPLSLLRKKLVKRFETIPALAALSLDKRIVHVEIDLPQYLFRSESLLLAVIVAVAKAATGSDRAERLVYSAEVGMDGALRRVGHLEDKARVIANHDGYRWVVAEESLARMAPEILAIAPGRVEAFGHTAALLRHLEIPEGLETKPAAKQTARRAAGWKLPAAALAGVAAALALILASNRFFVPGDLAMVWHLSDPQAGVLNMAQFVKWALVAGIALWLLYAGITRTGGQRAEKRRWPGGLWSVALLVLAVYAAASLQHFATTCRRYPDNFSRYERVEYLRHAGLLSGLTGGLPDYRYLEFTRLASRPTAPELQKAVEIGVATHPSDPAFGDTFVQVVVILMEKINSADLAEQVLRAYAIYVETLEHRSDARRLVADTLTAAEDLMTRYRLAQAPYQGQPYGDFLKDVSNRFQLSQ